MLASAAAVIWCLGTSTASADDWNRKTILTIDQTLAVPGATLAPGTYTFMLANPETSRDVVYIVREDGTLVTSAHVVHRQRSSDRRNLSLWVAFGEKGAVPTMKGWFFPAMMDGYQFVYPPAQARMIARAETAEIAVTPRG
jgi:hypothetical protein